MNRKAIVTAGVAALAVALTACDGGTVRLDEVQGNRDDLRYIAPVYKTREVDVKQRQCKSEVVKTKTGSTIRNTCKEVKTGTWSERYQDKPQKWCVELDAVNGEATDNDQWYRVDYGTYQLAGEMTEGSAIKFTPLALGC